MLTVKGSLTCRHQWAATCRAAITEAVPLTREEHPQTQRTPTCSDTEREAHCSLASVGEERQEGKKELLIHIPPQALPTNSQERLKLEPLLFLCYLCYCSRPCFLFSHHLLLHFLIGCNQVMYE